MRATRGTTPREEESTHRGDQSGPPLGGASAKGSILEVYYRNNDAYSKYALYRCPLSQSVQYHEVSYRNQQP